MKVEWIATFLIALIGTFLMGLSVQTTRDLSITVETIKNRMQSQEDQLAATKSQMSSVAGELTRIKETQAVMTPGPRKASCCGARKNAYSQIRRSIQN